VAQTICLGAFARPRGATSGWASGTFPPNVAAQVKAVACELPHRLGLPLSRLSSADIQDEVVKQGVVPKISRTTVWRWLDADALRPWQHRSWIFPRDPDFAGKAQRILDLYQGIWEGAPLAENDFVISADEKTSVQARRRKQSTLSPAPQRAMRVEHEYFREGAWTYLAAWDVHRAKLFGRCEAKSGIAPTDRLVAEVMSQEPYQSANRVFWIMDNGSAHRGQKAVQRLRAQWPNLILVHTPIHASWLNQIEIYFSIVQRKALTPNDFSSLAQLQQRLLDFQKRYESTASPFKWTFTRNDLGNLLAKLQQKAINLANSAANTLAAMLPASCAPGIDAPTAAA
jgi:transposase